MGQSMVPRGSTKKEICPKCGRYYYPYLNVNTLIKQCELCSPRPEKKE
jgi:hypothetical protein